VIPGDARDLDPHGLAIADRAHSDAAKADEIHVGLGVLPESNGLQQVRLHDPRNAIAGICHVVRLEETKPAQAVKCGQWCVDIHDCILRDALAFDRRY
jgi:hypothetical protein